MPFTCIYCRGIAAEPSESHIFSHALGGSAVIPYPCRRCNNEINTRVEQAALDFFDFHRSIFGIRGRRGEVPAVRATVEFEGREHRVLLGGTGEAIHPIVQKEIDQQGQGKPSYSAFGPGDVLSRWQEQMKERLAELRWQDREPHRVMAFVEMEDVGSLPMRRLAAKAAFEWFVKLRGPQVVLGDDFDAVRSFILGGDEPSPVAGVLSDERLLFGPLTFPVPSHAAYVIGHPLDRTLGAFVAFFGMHYFWVILSRKYTALAPFDELLIEYPQDREHDNPQLRRRNERVRVAWDELTRPWLENPGQVAESAKRSAGRKFSEAAGTFYGEAKSGD